MRRATPIPAILLLALVSITFGRICFHDFTWWDDDITIHHNLAFNPPTIHDTFACWRHAEHGMYVPVVYTTWGVLASYAWNTTADPSGIQLNAGIFHFASLLAHITTTLIVFSILRRLVRHDWAALAGAALYAVHPMQVETVAWATALKEGFCGLFGMAALWCYVAWAAGPCFPQKNTGGPPVPRSDARLYLIALVCVILAQLSNPLAVVIPMMAFVLDWVMIRRSLRKAALAVAPLLLVSIAGAIVAKAVQPGISAPSMPLWARPLVAADAVAFYLYKLGFPLHLAADYGRRPDLALARGWLYWTWICPAVVACAVIVLGRGRRWLWAGGLLFVIGVFPVLGFVRFDLQQYSTTADRYMYLALLGPALLVAAWFSAPRARWQQVAWAGVIAVLAARAAVQCGTWRNDMTLWQHTVAVSPDSYVAHGNLGAAYFRIQSMREALAECEASIRINPDYFQGHKNVAFFLLKESADHSQDPAVRDQLLDHAIVEMKETLRAVDRMPPLKRPHDPDLYYTLGAKLLERGRPAEAIAYLEEAAKIDANYPGVPDALRDARSRLATTRPQTLPER